MCDNPLDNPLFHVIIYAFTLIPCIFCRHSGCVGSHDQQPILSQHTLSSTFYDIFCPSFTFVSSVPLMYTSLSGKVGVLVVSSSPNTPFLDTLFITTSSHIILTILHPCFLPGIVGVLVVMITACFAAQIALSQPNALLVSIYHITHPFNTFYQRSTLLTYTIDTSYQE